VIDGRLKPGERQSERRPVGQKRLPLKLATMIFALAWLAVACYALAYLVSH